MEKHNGQLGQFLYVRDDGVAIISLLERLGSGSDCRSILRVWVTQVAFGRVVPAQNGTGVLCVKFGVRRTRDSCHMIAVRGRS